MTDEEDPGWGSPLRVASWLVPPLSTLLYRRRYRADLLLQQRRIFVGEIAALLAFLVAFHFIAPWSGGDAGVFPWLVVGAGVLCLMGIRWSRSRPLITSSTRQLAGSYRARFFIGFGMAMIPALGSLASTFVIGTEWIYSIGLTFSLIGLAMIAPTRGEFRRLQAEISASGSPLSIVGALRHGDALE